MPMEGYVQVPERRRVNIWFDDGWVQTFEVAYPIMKERGLTGTVALITGKVGSFWKPPKWPSGDKIMTLEQLQILVEEGWEIASHSVTHPYFEKLNEEETRYELSESKRWIIENLGVTPTKFVAPRNRIRDDQVKLVMEYYSYLRHLCPPGHYVLHRPDRGGLLALLNRLNE